MKCKKLSFLLLLLVVSLQTYAKKPKEPQMSNFNIIIEAGASHMEADLNDKWRIRNLNNFHATSNHSDSYYQSSAKAYGSTNGNYLAIKGEYLFAKRQFGIASGLRLTRIHSKLTPTNSNNDNYFYLAYKTNGTDTYYTRLDGIYENNYFIGVPVELKCIPLQFELVGLYAKIGVDFNFRVGSKVDMLFTNSEMLKYEQDIFDLLDIKTNIFYSTFYSAIGIKFGQKDKINCNLEFLLPSFVLTQNNATLLDPSIYNGFQLGLQIPIKVKEKKKKKRITIEFN